MSGVLYRAEWLSPSGGACGVRFRNAEELREGGNCLHLACRHDEARQWWCYRPRDQDDGTLSLLAEWAPEHTGRRRKRIHRIATAR